MYSGIFFSIRIKHRLSEKLLQLLLRRYWTCGKVCPNIPLSYRCSHIWCILLRFPNIVLFGIDDTALEIIFRAIDFNCINVKGLNIFTINGRNNFLNISLCCKLWETPWTLKLDGHIKMYKQGINEEDVERMKKNEQTMKKHERLYEEA